MSTYFSKIKNNQNLNIIIYKTISKQKEQNTKAWMTVKKK